LAGLIVRFTYLKVGLAALLVFAGLKILVSDFYKMPVIVSLSVILIILGVSVVASVWQARRGGSDPDADSTDPSATDPGTSDHPARPSPLEA
jgi:tellurite resistance protein TerC